MVKKMDDIQLTAIKTTARRIVGLVGSIEKYPYKITDLNFEVNKLNEWLKKIKE